MASTGDARLAARRGREAPGASFGYLFRWAPEAEDDPRMEARFAALAAAMAEDERDPDRDDHGAPAMLGLFGQFLEHELAAMSDLRTPSGRSPEAAGLRPRARDEVERSLVNLREGRLGLDALYDPDVGGGPLAAKIARLMREPGAPARLRLDVPHPSALGRTARPADRGADLLRLGRVLSEDPATGITEAEIRALPPGLRRSFLRDGEVNPARALTGDLRADSNLSRAQLQVALARFHNRVVDWLVDERRVAPGSLDREARRLVRLHVQWLALNHWLPRLCRPGVLSRVRRAGAPFATEMIHGMRERGQRRQPVGLEWWAAVSRFRMSMARSGIELNALHPRADLEILFGSTGATMATPRLPADRVVEWGRLVRPRVRPGRAAVEAAESAAMGGAPGPTRPCRRGLAAIGTQLSPHERHAEVFRSWAMTTLGKGHALNLPPAQACAAELNEVYAGLVRPLGREALCGGHTGEAVRDGLDEATPLWFYILREAEVQRDGRGLGDLGSAILAETLIGALAADPESVWHARGPRGLPWSPADGARPGGIVVDDFEALLKAAELM